MRTRTQAGQIAFSRRSVGIGPSLVALLSLAMFAAACTSSDQQAEPEAVETPSSLDEDTFSTAPEMETAPTSIEDRYSFAALSSGAGGFVTGASASLDWSSFIMRTDVGGVYLRDEAGERWVQLLDADKISSPEPEDWNVESAVVAPGDPDRIYLSVGQNLNEPAGRVLTSTDRGDTWTASEQRFTVAGNGDWRTGAERLAVNPVDADDVWLGTRTEGLWRSRDGGVTFTNIAAIPVGTSDADPAGVMFVVMNETGTQVWAGVAGVGVLTSADDGATWTSLWADDGVPVDAELASDGTLWVVGRNPATVRSVQGASSGAAASVVTEFEPQSGRRWETVAIDPADPAHVIVGDVGIGDHTYRTIDAGQTWTRMQVTTSCPEIPWLDSYDDTFLPSGSMIFDRSTPGRIWIPEGFGVWRADLDATDVLAMECDTLGIEELVSNDAVALSDGRVVTAHWDRPLFFHDGNTPADAIVNPSDRFNTAWDIDVSPSDPDFLVAVIGDQRFCCEDDGLAYHSGYSTDAGKTWTRFASYEAGHPDELRFGNIAISADDTNNLVWLPSYNGAVHFTRDGGATWERVVLPGTEDMVQDDNGIYRGGSHQQYYLNRKVLAADRLNPGTFFLYHQELGVFRSTDGGQNWELLASEGLPTGWTVGWFASSLVVSPYDSDHLLFTPGELNESDVPMYQSIDGGQSWEPVPGTVSISAIAVGPAEVGADSGQPIVYISGIVDGQHGIYRSIDGLENWQLITSAPLGNYQKVKALAVAPDVPGLLYVGFTGTSFMVGSLEPTGE